MKKIEILFRIAAFFTCMLMAAFIQAQNNVVGTVTYNGKPVGEVQISQVGTGIATSTNYQGKYQITIQGKDAVLLFQHPDYSEEKTAVNQRKQININMTERVNKIEEVVLNAGYYKVKEKESTGSIAKVSAKEIENQPVNNVLGAVQGRMAGVSIVQNSGTPGGGFDVQIRGKNSLRRLGNGALYIVDGMVLNNESPSTYGTGAFAYGEISPLNSINPNDIESIEVLKDADATAIYGSRGANGVVVITTKTGRKGSPKVTITSSLGLSEVSTRMKMMNSAQYLDMRQQAYKNDGISNYPANASDLNGRWDKTRYTDWQKVLLGNTSEISENQFSVSGGSEEAKFYVSAAHLENGTVFPANFRYKTNRIASNFSFKPTGKRWEFGVSNQLSFLSNNTVSQSFTNRALFLSPNAPALYDDQGNLNWQNNTFSNPVAILSGEYLNESKLMLNNVTVSYQLNDNLKLKIHNGLSSQFFEEFRMTPHTVYNPSSGLGPESSSSFRTNLRQSSWLLEPQLNWLKVLGRHDLDFLLGASYQQDQTMRTAAQGYGFDSNAFLQNISAAKTLISSESNAFYKYAAVFSRFNYQYAKKYIVNLTARRDGSSRFGENRRFANFGAVGAAWIFSSEQFMDHIKWLSFGKLRGSWGIIGNDQIGDYQFLDTYSIGEVYNGNSTLYPSRLKNPGFSWEKTTKLEGSLDIGLFKDRVFFSAAWYRNVSTNQLVGTPLPGTTGFNSIQSNLPATVLNTGMEFELKAHMLKNSQFSWKTSGNVSFPTSKLLAFPNLEGSTYANQFVLGEPISIVKVYQFEGVNPLTGVYQFKDFDGDGKISSPADNKVIENVGVEFFGGWHNEFKHKNWDLSFLFQFVKQRNWNYNSYMPMPGTMNNQPLEVLNVWSPSNPNGLYMPYSSGAASKYVLAHSNFTKSTAAISDASFIRLKNIQLSYSIPTKGMWISNAKVFVQGQNLLTFTKYFGPDPEFVLPSLLPPLKTYSFGVQLKF